MSVQKTRNRPKAKQSPKKAVKQIKPKLRHWTRDEYYQIVTAGVFGDERVELLWGKVVTMPPMLTNHAAGIELTEVALESAFGSGYWIRTQMPLDLSEHSSPEPDVAVIAGGPRDYLGDHHPATALLVVEVSESTLREDRKLKAPLYASANLQEYWIVNLVDHQLEVYRDPQPDASNLKNSRYGQLTTLKPTETISPLALPSATINLSDLLP